jgi:hypothetical protein
MGVLTHFPVTAADLMVMVYTVASLASGDLQRGIWKASERKVGAQCITLLHPSSTHHTNTGARAFINGRASPNEAVAVAFGQAPDSSEPLVEEVVFNTVAAADGTWIIEVLSSACGGGCTVTVTGADDGPAVVAQNVHFGEVFFCSGP